MITGKFTGILLLLIIASILPSVMSVPSFLEEPENTTVIIEQGSQDVKTISLSFRIKGFDSQGVIDKTSWIKNDVIISDTYHFRQNISHLKDSRYSIDSRTEYGRYDLQIDAVTEETAEFDSGRYQCALQWGANDTNIIQSSIVNVKVYIIPKGEYPICEKDIPEGTHNKVSSSKIEVVEGTQVIMSCKSYNGIPQVALQWRDFHNIMTSSKGSLTEGEDELVVVNVTWTAMRTGNNIFVCTLYHPGLMENRTCDIGPITVLFKPTVEIIPHTHVMSTEAVSFYCKASSNPRVEQYKWTYDGTEIGENTHDGIKQQNETLIIEYIPGREADRHNITCIAINALGSTSSEIATLLPKTPMSVTSMPMKQSGTQVSLIAGVVGAYVGVILIGLLVILSIYIIKSKRRATSSKRGDENTTSEQNLNISSTQIENYYSSNDGYSSDLPDDSDIQNRHESRSNSTAPTITPENETNLSSSYATVDMTKKKPKRTKNSDPNLKLPDTPTQDENTPDVNNSRDPTENETDLSYMYASVDMAKKKMKRTEKSEPNLKQSDTFKQDVNTPDVNNSKDREVKPNEKKPSLKNVEGLTYAELDLSSIIASNVKVKGDQRQSTKDLVESTVYAEVRL